MLDIRLELSQVRRQTCCRKAASIFIAMSREMSAFVVRSAVLGTSSSTAAVRGTVASLLLADWFVGTSSSEADRVFIVVAMLSGVAWSAFMGASSSTTAVLTTAVRTGIIAFIFIGMLRVIFITVRAYRSTAIRLR